jgi:hypothetical protein
MYIVGGWVCHGFNIQHIWVAADVAAAPEDLQSHISVEYRKTNLSVASSMSTLAVYLTCERLRRNMLQVAYVLSLRRTSTSSTGDGLPTRHPNISKARFGDRFQNESIDANIMRNPSHTNRQPPTPAREIQCTLMLLPEPGLPLDAPANSSSKS